MQVHRRPNKHSATSLTEIYDRKEHRSRASSQAAPTAALSGSGRDNPQSTAASGTRRARSRLRGPAVRSIEFMYAACLDSIARLPAAGTIPRIFRIMDSSAVTARAVRGMSRVRAGSRLALVPCTYNRRATPDLGLARTGNVASKLGLLWQADAAWRTRLSFLPGWA